MQTTEVNSNPMETPELDNYTIRQIVDLYRGGRGKLNLNPSFQRKSVWKKNERSKLMNTILRQYPLPAVVFCKRRDARTNMSVLDVIDGKQRIETILLYLGEMRGDDKGFAAEFSHFEDGEEKKKKLAWKELSKRNQDAILHYQIPVVTIDAGPSEIRDIFVRINSTGKALTRQEIRNANYVDSPFLKGMTLFAKKMRNSLQKMNVISDGDVDRMRDIEFLSEIVVSIMQGSVLDKKRALDRIMSPNGVDMRGFVSATNRVKWVVGYLKKLLPNMNETRFRKAADFYTLVLVLNDMNEAGEALQDEESIYIARTLLTDFGAKVDKAYEDVRNFNRDTELDPKSLAYVQTVTGGSDNAKYRRERAAILNELLQGVFKSKDGHRFFNGTQRRIIWSQTHDHRCCRCHVQLQWPDFEIDHVKPHSKGGKTDLANSALICKSCNSSKGNRIGRTARARSVDRLSAMDELPPIGKMVQVLFPEVFRRGLVTAQEVRFLLSCESGKRFGSAGYAVLSRKRLRDAAGIARYYSKEAVPILFQGKTYYLSSQFKNSGRGSIVAWLADKGISVREVVRLIGER